MSSYPCPGHVLWPNVFAVSKGEVGHPWASLAAPYQGHPLYTCLCVQRGVAHKPPPGAFAAIISPGNSTEMFPGMTLMR